MRATHNQAVTIITLTAWGYALSEHCARCGSKVVHCSLSFAALKRPLVHRCALGAQRFS
jgi:hypothetical protein